MAGFWERHRWLRALVAAGGIRLKLVAVFTPLLAAALALLLFAGESLFTSAIQERVRAECRALALAVAGACGEDLLLAEGDALTRSRLGEMINALRQDLAQRRVRGLWELAVIRREPGAPPGLTVLVSTAAAPQAPDAGLRERFAETLAREEVQESAIYRPPPEGGPPAPALEFRRNIILRDKDLGAKTVGLVRLVFDLEAVRGPARELQRLVIWGGLILLGVTVLVVWLAAHSFTRPLVAAARAAAEVGRGNLDVSVPVTSRDEVGRLAEAFNGMVGHLREKLALLKFVSPATVNMVRDRLPQGEVTLGGERRELALLFTDIRGFTALTDAAEPEEAVAVLNHFLDLQARAIEQEGGVVDKFIGDQVMAVFAGERREERACRAALAIRRRLRDEAGAEGPSRTLREQGLGLGLAAGSALMGNVGSAERMDHTPIGDCVNVAARLCAAARPWQILVTAEVQAAAGGVLRFRRGKELLLKGKSEPVLVYDLLGEKSPAEEEKP